MNHPNDLGEQQLNRMYDDLSKEQMRLMADFKNSDDKAKGIDIQKQLTLLNSSFPSLPSVHRPPHRRKKIDCVCA